MFYKNKQQGFTLVELIVSVSIIALVSSIFLANFHKYGSKGNVDMSAQKIASDIRMIQSYAFGLKEFNGSRPEGGWGIYFNKANNDEYIVFADDNDGHDYDVLEEYRTIKTNNTQISNLKVNGTNKNWISVIAEPPNPTIWICDNTPDCSTTTNAEIILESSDEQKTIEINCFGLIDIK